MATLEKIRQKGVLLTVIIGGALLAFIIGGIDFTTIRQGARETVAIINGEEIKIAEYESRLDEMTTFYKIELGQSSLSEEYVEQIRNYVWSTWESEQLLGKQAEILGLKVTDEELANAVYGDQIHPTLQSARLFYNEQGMFDRNLMLQFLRSINMDETGEALKYWNFLERVLKNTLLQEKYYTLVFESININDIDAKNAFNARTQSTGLEFVMQPYFSLPDSLFVPTEKEIKQRYAREKQKFIQHEETRDLLVVLYDVLPSEKDHEEIKTWIEKLKEEFATAPDYFALANQNSDIPNKDVALSRKDIDADIQEFAFTASVGEVFGPIFVNGVYKMARLSEKGIIASDSAKVRHILIQENDINATQKLVDSLVAVLKKGEEFATIAARYSKAGSAAQGGELGWVKDGEWDKDFSNKAINAKINDIVTVQIGAGIHIMQVTEKTKPVEKVKIATIIRKVEPTSRTYGIRFNEASQFVAQNRTVEKFENATKENNSLAVRKYTVSTKETRIANINDSRQIIRWAFENKEGDVSDKVFESGNQFVVAAIKKVNPKGIKTLEDVREQIVAELIREKKADKIAVELSEKLAKTNNINDLGLSLQVVESVSFETPFVPSMGREPKVLGSLPKLIITQQPMIIKGNAGVFVVQSVNVGAQPEMSIEAEKAQLRQRMFNQNTLLESLRKSSAIQDNRIRFY